MKKFVFTPKRTITLLLAIFFVGFTVYLMIVVSRINAEWFSGLPNESAETLLASGQVTERQTSCGGERLMDDGTIQRYGVCDAGNSLTVNDISIATGGGYCCNFDPQYYITDIDNIRAGDLVDIRYVVEYSSTGRTYETTNCPTCYVKKKNGTPEEHQLVDSRARAIERSTIGLPILIGQSITNFFDFESNGGHIISWLIRLYILTGAYLLVVFGIFLYRKTPWPRKAISPRLHNIPNPIEFIRSPIKLTVQNGIIMVIVGVALIAAVLIPLFTEGTFLNGVMKCGGLPREIYKDSSGNTDHREPGERGYGIHLGSDYYVCSGR